jgi:CHAT domain-containing protein/Flp pilus assembly protein TadD
MLDMGGTRRWRSGRVGSAFLVLAVVYCAETVAPRAQEAQVLVRGEKRERALAPGETHLYRVTLNAGDFLQVRIDKYGVEVVAKVIGPDDRERVTVQADPDPFEPEIVALIADISGAFVLSIRQPLASTVSGRYAVIVDEWRGATPEDRTRIDAERAIHRANTLQALRHSTQDLVEALNGYTSARESFRQLGLGQRELRALFGVAAAQAELGRPEQLDSARSAERLARELDDKPVRAGATNLIGVGLERAGDLETARVEYEEAARLAHSIGSGRAESVFLSNEGIIYGRTGDFELAIARFERALSLAKEAGYKVGEESALNNLGVSYKNLGEFEQALDAYRQAQAAHKAGRQVDREALALNNIGNVEQLLGRPEQALADHFEALALSRQIGNRENEARSLNTIGQTYAALGKDAEALDYHREALTIRRQIGDLPGQGAALDGAGRALRRLGNREGAADALDESLAIRRSIRDRTGEIETLRDRAMLRRDEERIGDAVADIRAAVELEEELRSRLTSPELRGSFGAFQHDKYELFVDLLQQQRHDDPALQYERDALGVADRGRARVLLESLLDARVDFRQGAERELIDRDLALQRQLNNASLQLSRILTKGSRDDQSAAAARSVEDLAHRYDMLQAEIRRGSPRYADLMQPRSLTASEIQQQVLDTNTVLLEFALGEERSWLWAVTSMTLTSVELPPRREIDAAARAVYDQLTARQRKPGEASDAYHRRVASADRELAGSSAALSDLLFGAVARLLNADWRGKRLAIVATGSLEYVPFAALPRPRDAASRAARATGRATLAGDHEIVCLPSASVVAALRRDSDSRPRATRQIAIFADPVFDVDDPRVVRADRPARHDLTSQPASGALARISLGRLAFSREEALTIATLAGAQGVLSATDFDASRATALNGGLGQYRIVHFATHGAIDSEHTALSGLVLSLVDEHGRLQDGYLRVHDIYGMHLDADLVVLSACQTALGKEIRGEGLVGLTRAFMYAGASRVVASLWEVNDLATAELMKRFYTAMWQRRLRPAAALRAAQIEMSREPRWASPYYWAGFEIQGDWR